MGLTNFLIGFSTYIFLGQWIFFRYVLKRVEGGYIIQERVERMVPNPFDPRKYPTLWAVYVGILLCPLGLALLFCMWVFVVGTGVSLGFYSNDVFGNFSPLFVIPVFFIGLTTIAAFVTDYVKRIDRYLLYSHEEE